LEVLVGKKEEEGRDEIFIILVKRITEKSKEQYKKK
jgi:hypothetical protein